MKARTLRRSALALLALSLALPALTAPALAAPAIDDPDLKAAVANIKGDGPDLLATFTTNLGQINCRLLFQRSPKTVANFAGLATGNKPWKDPKTGQEVTGKPLYDGLIFHRVIPEFMIQGGDPKGNGTGGPGFAIKDEFHPELKHDRGGLLSMANSGPNTGGSQFFLTEKATPWLDGKHAIFGECKEIDVVKKIARVPVEPGNRPKAPVNLEKLVISWGKY